MIKPIQMGVVDIREKIIAMIGKSEDDRLLSMVYAMLEAYDNVDIVGYDFDGNPISKEQLQEDVIAASKRVKDGNYISQEEMEKRVSNW